MRDGGKITVMAFYFPNWHPDPRNEQVHGRGWTEWEVVRCARPRFPGHVQPRVPVWGYEDESEPAVMERKIAAARQHGIDGFLFDWYYSNEGSFREKVLNNAFLKAANLSDTKFAVMWCNHARQGVHPAPYTMHPETFSPAGVSAANHEVMADHLVRDYFRHPNYWKIGGRPFYAIYAIRQFVNDCGSVEAAAAMLDSLRRKAREAGFPGIHLHVTDGGLEWMEKIVTGVDPMPENDPLLPWAGRSGEELIRVLGIDSTGDYGWPVSGDFPKTDSAGVLRDITARWRRKIGGGPVPFYPSAMTGWDPSPRTVQSDKYEPRGYPFVATWSLTPAEYRSALAGMRELLAARPPAERVCLLSAWNEWTEGAYLEPDTVNGCAYLETVREVYGAGRNFQFQPLEV